MEESYETDTSSLTSSINGVSSGCMQDAIIPDSDENAIPVTFIGEVLDDRSHHSCFFGKTCEQQGLTAKK